MDNCVLRDFVIWSRGVERDGVSQKDRMTTPSAFDSSFSEAVRTMFLVAQSEESFLSVNDETSFPLRFVSAFAEMISAEDGVKQSGRPIP